MCNQVLREIESKAQFSAQQLQIVRGQISSKTREKRMLELSSTELDGLPKDTPIYDGVGKMYGVIGFRSEDLSNMLIIIGSCLPLHKM